MSSSGLLCPPAAVGALVLIGAAVAGGCIERRSFVDDTIDAPIDSPSDVPIDTPIDMSIDTPIDVPPAGCTANPSICMAPDLNCVNNACVDCAVADDQQSGDCTDRMAPVCGVGNDCRACQDHDECGSGVCVGGVCLEDVLYVAPSGSDNGGTNACTSSVMPCRTLTHAITRVPAFGGNSANRRYIRLLAAGTYVEPGVVVIDGKAAVIIGTSPAAGRAVFDRAGDGNTIIVQNSAEVGLERIAIRNGTTSTISTMLVGGVTCSNATLVAVGIEISNDQALGIETSGCQLTVRRSLIARNVRGGISADGGRAVIVDDVIVENGGASATFGGVRLGTGVAVSSVLQSNTLVNNVSRNAATTDGIECLVPGLTARNNIVVGASNHQRVDGSCAYTNTLYGPNDTTGALGSANGNLLVPDTTAFQFVNTAAFDYHLIIGAAMPSIARGRGTTTGLAPEAMTDLDGESRPQGLPDVGADEIP